MYNIVNGVLADYLQTVTTYNVMLLSCNGQSGTGVTVITTITISLCRKINLT